LSFAMTSELASTRLLRLHLSTHLDRLFGPFEVAEADLLERLLDATALRALPAGEDLFRQGQPAGAAYILLLGSLRVAVEGPDGSEQVINEVAPGETVGEMALLTDDPRSATIYAVRDSVLARIPREQFDRLIEERPAAMRSLSRILSARLKRRSEVQARREGLRTCIALLGAHPAVPLDEIARLLGEAVSRHGPVALLTSAGADAVLGRPAGAQGADAGPAQLRLTEWLHQQEASCRYVLYQADAAWSPWTERCVRQADHVVVVAEGRGPAEPGEIEARFAGRWRRGREPRRSLVLLHPAEADRPAGTARWTAGRDLDAVYHLRRRHAGDLARLGRILAGRAVGLVLGGGGARGFAHLGVLRALDELGVPVDMIGGASIGAAIAGFAAQGRSAREAAAAASRAFRSLIDYTLPISSLLAGRRITESILRESGEWDIEDFWLPFFCVSTSLTKSRTVVHRRGSSARAVRASVAIPGVLPPVTEAGELLVDGGVLNNLPVDVMRALNPTGPVLAIDVVPPHGPPPPADYGLSLSGWVLAFDRIAPWRRARRVPGLANTVLRSMLVGAGRAREDMLRAGLADLYVNIPVRGVGLLEFERVDEVSEIGYREAIEPLRGWAAARGPQGG
jgi:predicted acylesterase/phospholipase RssA/CRP-like cAMP-binding protein